MRRYTLPAILAVVAVALGAAALRAGADTDPPEPSALAHPVTPVLSVRRVPVWLASPAADRALAERMNAIVARSPERTCLVVADGSRTLYAHQAGAPATPASAQKLVTATAALEVLGPETRLRTTVVAAAAPAGDGVVAGDLWMVGGGDPLLATRSYRDHFEHQPQIATPLESLADAIVAAGVLRISGRIIGDDSRYDAERYVAAWPFRFRTQNQSGPLSALTVDDGFVDYPPEQFEGAPEEDPSGDPPALAADLLTTLLKERNVVVVGDAASGVAPAEAVELAAVESPPVRDVVNEMLAESDNQTAELLVKEMGRVRTGQGTTAAGVQVVNETVAALGLADAGTFATDGSGLDDANRVSCRMLAGVLDRGGDALAGGLAVAGETGTLAERFLVSPARGRVRAKTGTLNDVTSLAGFVDTAQGQVLTFAYVANDRLVTDELLAVQEDMAADLVAHPVGPPLEALSPVPVR